MNKKIICRVSLAAIAILSLIGLLRPQEVFAASSTDPWWVQQAIDDSDQEGCTRKTSGFGWLLCSANKFISGAALNIFDVVDGLLMTDPDVFQNVALIEGWKTVRNIANLAIFAMLVVVILSQISGIGISNYGIKKSLPRILAVVVLINLSLILCRIAVDVMNLSAEAIKNTFETLTATARQRITYDPGNAFAALMGGGTHMVLMVALAFFGTKSFLASGESIVMLGLFAIVAIIIGIILFFATIVVRSALVVLLSVTAPGAIILAVFPGTKKTFNKWFDLFKGVLICYPMAALMVYGGDFAATIAMAALGVNEITVGVGSTAIHIPVNVFTLMVAAAANIAPLIMLPGLVIKSTGAIGAAMQGFARTMTSAISGFAGGTAPIQNLQRKETDMRNRIRAGVDKDGNERTGRLARFMRSNSPEDRMEAQKALAASRARRRSENIAGELGGMDADDETSKAAYDSYVSGESFEVTNEDAVNEKFDDIFGSSSDADEIASKVDGLMRYINEQNPKNGAEDILKKRLDGISDGRIRQAVAAKRLARSGGNMMAKTPQDHAYYSMLARGDNVQAFVRQGNKDVVNPALMEEVVNNSDYGFNAAALSNYAKPMLGGLASYVRSHGGNDQTSRRIASAYTQMLQTSGYGSNAASEDFDGLKAAIISKGLGGEGLS